MPHEYIYGQNRNASLTRGGKLTRPTEPRGVPDTGRIVKLFTGQGYGIIRLGDGREIYFHRADMQEGTSINDVAVGDVVSFERLDDRISGARALGVVKLRQRRR
jgi:cold shock CspA family protein